MTVEWARIDLYQTDNLVHLFEDYSDITYHQRQSYRGRTALFKEELLRGNTSLKLSAVQPSDEGAYKCVVRDRKSKWYDDVTLYVKVKGKDDIKINVTITHIVYLNHCKTLLP
uniref:Ig-like domain-containing protein n=1 Tax=Astyanax mexicanus TaxID=7994 RepID=A0A3B1K757_ASTMX